MQSTQVLDAHKQMVGTYQRSVNTSDGELLLIAREERFGGGTIVVPEREASKSNGVLSLPYSELSIREVPPYSPNVALHAYSEFWKRLGVSNFNVSMAGYIPTGSGPVPCEVEIPDEHLLEAVTAALRGATDGDVDYHLIRVSVKRGTVLLEGYQNDTQRRLAAAETVARVPGVKEIVNMLVVRALL